MPWIKVQGFLFEEVDVPQRDTDSSDMVARAVGVVLPAGDNKNGDPTDEEFALITQFGDDRADRKPNDYYSFRMIVSSDGMDSFYTRPDPATSLRNYIDDLKHAQSLMGSHQTATFSYGLSYDGELLDADPQRREYEASFFRRFSGIPEAMTSKWAIGKFAIPRGIELNGQKTDDLIRSLQLGNIRRSSISFTVGAYRCEIDGKDMIAGFFGPEGTGDCRHMPGVKYGKRVATALMVDNDLHETSLVFKNSSPSSMFLRKAEEMARRGMISEPDIVRLEERMATRLPRRDTTRQFTGTEVAMAGQDERHTGHYHVGLNTDAEDIKGGHGADYEDEPGDEINDPAAAAEMLAPGILDEMNQQGEKPAPSPDEEEATTVVVKKPAVRAEDAKADETLGEATAADITEGEGTLGFPDTETPEVDAEERHKGHKHEGDTVGGHFSKKPRPFKDPKASDDDEDDESDSADDGETSAERMAKGRRMARQVLGRISSFEARDAEIGDILGEPLTVEAVRRLDRDASLGRDLFNREVDKAVKARVAVDGEAFNAEKWRALLASSRDLELVQSETEAWSKRRADSFTAGRQVKPGPLPERTAATAPPAPEPGVNILASLTKPQKS